MFDLAAWITLLPAFALVAARLSGIMLSAPIFSSSAIAAPVKIGLVALLALVVFPVVLPRMTAVPETLVAAVVGMLGELAVGFAIGLAVNLLMIGLQTAAQMIGQQMGLGLARVFNPAVEDETDVLSQFYLLVGLALLLLMGGHRLILAAVLDSFAALPPMTVTLEPRVFHILIGLLQAAFVLAFKIAVPALLVLFLVTLMMGFLGRTVPQINILVVGFPLRVAVGLLALVVAFGVGMTVFGDGYQQTVDAVGEMIRSLGT